VDKPIKGAEMNINVICEGNPVDQKPGKLADYTTYNYLLISMGLLDVYEEISGGSELNPTVIEAIQKEALNMAQQLSPSVKLETVKEVQFKDIARSLDVNNYSESHIIEHDINHADPTELPEIGDDFDFPDEVILHKDRLELFKSNVADCYNPKKKPNPAKLEQFYGEHVSELIEAAERFEKIYNLLSKQLQKCEKELIDTASEAVQSDFKIQELQAENEKLKEENRELSGLIRHSNGAFLHVINQATKVTEKLTRKAVNL
jgi:hypothetical protein